MDTRWKSFSHSIVTKIIVFIITALSFAGGATAFLNILEVNNGSLDIIIEDSYYQSQKLIEEGEEITGILTNLLIDYKSQDHILNGETITQNEIKRQEENLFSEFKATNQKYHYNINDREHYEEFQESYSEELSKIEDELIKEDFQEYNTLLQRLNRYKDIKYYASDGTNIYTNVDNANKNYFKNHPSYMMFDKNEESIYPIEIKGANRYHWITSNIRKLNVQEHTLYIAMTEDYLNTRIQEWEREKSFVTDRAYKVGIFFVIFIVFFIYLLLVTGRKSFGDKEVYLNNGYELYNDLNLVMCFSIIALWVGTMNMIYNHDFLIAIFPITLIVTIVGLLLILSLFRHIKNRSLIRHTLAYKILHKLYRFLLDIYNGGSLAVKIVLIVVGFPMLIAGTVFYFPFTVATVSLGVWLALKKVKEYNAIKEGVEKIKMGDIHHKIEILSSGELGKLGKDINSIADGLNQAVANELKSERLKTELITNVSHDIRTPLTSIITYVDLLKREEDKSKIEEYIGIIEQKSHRLKSLTDDLFEASKASSGSIPVNLEKIDIVSLITQGLGELNEEIEESELEFRLNHPNGKAYVKADGKLLWRAIENLLSNIFKYALKGSRVYIDIYELENEIALTIKNISAYELNISSQELMERFKRGDEARASEGSGLGLSIAKSLIDIQNGSFNIEIDGDLFKAMIKIPKYNL